ncbi:hypothetical protein [Sinomonas sp. R1AF57]|uniref:hypothetical protein n=1 Tax=Sinomonas sp. R1AF57 TaxID=2020377 RepID=UPI001ABF466C|nr:hypothetical protein [Sinomonas sp. R1AF57]
MIGDLMFRAERPSPDQDDVGLLPAGLMPLGDQPAAMESQTGATVELANRADLVFVWLDEAQALWGCATPDDVRVLLPGPGTLLAKVVRHDGRYERFECR